MLPQGNILNHTEIFNPQIPNKLKEWQSNNTHIPLGVVKERHSNATQTSYMSFFGDWYLKELVRDTMYEKQGDIADFVLRDYVSDLEIKGF